MTAPIRFPVNHRLRAARDVARDPGASIAALTEAAFVLRSQGDYTDWGLAAEAEKIVLTWAAEERARRIVAELDVPFEWVDPPPNRWRFDVVTAICGAAVVAFFVGAVAVELAWTGWNRAAVEAGE